MAEQLELFPNEFPPAEQGTTEAKEVTPIEDCEWCFQFFDNPPITFAWNKEGVTASPLILQIEPNENDALAFRQNGMEFKIFPRPISEKTKLEREKENKQ